MRSDLSKFLVDSDRVREMRVDNPFRVIWGWIINTNISWKCSYKVRVINPESRILSENF